MLPNLKAALLARGIRQVELCATLGIPPSVLSEIIHGRRKAGESLRGRIAGELRADEGWLFSTAPIIPAQRARKDESLTPMPVTA